jgi:hypothetical protein
MSFSDQIKVFKKKAEKRSEQVVRGTALSMFSKIVLATPVGNTALWDTKYPPKGYTGGRLRGNWQVSLGSAADGEVNREDKAGRTTIGKGGAIIAGHKGDGSIFISNNLPYAKRVEDGWSKQAPAGMVKVVLAQFKRIVRGQLR